MRRKDRQLSEQEALVILKNCEYATLATIDALTGRPYCIPISPVLDGKVVYFHCAPSGEKLDNLLEDARVCLSCVGKHRLMPMDFSVEYESAVVFGTAKMVEEDLQKHYALKKICEKYAPENMANFEQAVKQSMHRTAIVKIKITEITGKAKRYNQPTND